MRLLATTVCAGLAAALLTACPDREVSRVDPLQDNVETKKVPVNLNRNLDLLFVVDNSGSMLAEQQQLTANFPQFINVLNSIQGGLPDIHIGIVSSDVGSAGQTGVGGCSHGPNNQGDDGNLLTGPPGNTCATTYGLQGNFISDIALSNGTRMKNYTGNLNQLFACMASLGTAGCGFEMHLESMYRALQPGKNPGFYRADAFLGVVIIADEDDCSTENGAMFGDPNAGLTSPLGPRTSFRCAEFGIRCDNDPNPRAFGTKMGCKPDPASQYMFEVDKYINFLRSLKTDPKLVIVAGIIGNFDEATRQLVVGPDPTNATYPEVAKSCFTRDPNDPDDGATFPVRQSAFLDAFPERNTRTTICSDNLSDGLVQIANLLKLAIGNPCIEGDLADRNPNIDGVQYECTVTDVTNPDSPNRTETVIPECKTPRVTPCWEFVSDPQQCPTAPMNRAIKVDRGGATPPVGTVMELQCVVN